MKNIQRIIPVIILVLLSCNRDKELVITHSDPSIQYEGRIEHSIESSILRWSGSSVSINFEGSSVDILIADETGDNYYNILVDDDSCRLFRPDTMKGWVNLASGLSPGKHSISLFKRTEWTRGRTDFYGFRILENAAILDPEQAKERKIEFYGNSITAGYAVEDSSENDSPDSTYTNNYLSYAALTARHFDAEYSCICRSGIGITISWFPMIMSEMYDLLDPDDPDSKWDFSLYTPDIVVINLFQNDSWLVDMPEREEFGARFGDKAPKPEYLIDAYSRFIASIRNKYPNAEIICCLGSMDATAEGSEWPGYIKKAVSTLRDKSIHTLFFPFKQTPGHPGIEEQKLMSEQLIGFIEKNINW